MTQTPPAMSASRAPRPLRLLVGLAVAAGLGIGPVGWLPAARAQEAQVAQEPAGPAPAPGARVQQGTPPAPDAGRERPARPADAAASPNANARRLPPDSTTEHTVEAGGRTLRFKATAGSIPLFDGEGGALRAEVGYVAFTVGPDAGSGNQAGAAGPARPVTFLFNGGPGAASAYLNIGAIGPWRLPLDGATASTPPVLVPNAETWLDFTDLVFIDPPGTGYSRLVGGEPVRRQLWSVDGDAEALAVVVRKWIDQHGRQGAPKLLVGESYGGFRVPKLARTLATREGVGVRGLILVSPVLDFASLGQRRHQPQSWIAALPSMAAAALERKNAFSAEALAAAERYAATDYLADLMRGERDTAAVDRMTARVAALTGLDPALVKRLAGRVDTATFQRELWRSRGLVGSAYDATVTAFDPEPSAARTHFPDPVLDSTKAPIVAAMSELYRGRLRWSHDQLYRLLNDEVSGQWGWGRGRSAPQVVDEVRTVLASDRDARILVAHGASDLVTPYFANKLILDQLPVYGAADRAALKVYRGGHMFYAQDDSRKALRRDAEAFYRAALQGAAKE
ncbi:peptidase S10 [Rhodoplanes sp.]|uniref:S10 family peptidase n=1 Tax=Rhodoplanes sp. TaxID=1968906 RepID=UPI0025F8CDD5|nr:peptidase S10 [Rhodoplanes sp.]